MSSPADAPDAAAVLDFFTHQGEAMWTLNVTGVEGMSAAKIVYGNPNVYGEEGEGSGVFLAVLAPCLQPNIRMPCQYSNQSPVLASLCLTLPCPFSLWFLLWLQL